MTKKISSKTGKTRQSGKDSKTDKDKPKKVKNAEIISLKESINKRASNQMAQFVKDIVKQKKKQNKLEEKKKHSKNKEKTEIQTKNVPQRNPTKPKKGKKSPRKGPHLRIVK